MPEYISESSSVHFIINKSPGSSDLHNSDCPPSQDIVMFPSTATKSVSEKESVIRENIFLSRDLKQELLWSIQNLEI